MSKNALKYPSIAITILLALLMLVATASAWIKPSTSMIPAYLGIAFPYIALINVAVALLWMIRRDWMMVVPIATLLLCGHNLQKTIGIHGRTDNEDLKKTDLKVLTYNVSLFDFHNDYDEMLDYIKEKSADIVCLQEYGFYKKKENYHLTKEKIENKLGSIYPYYHFNKVGGNKKRDYGEIIFSKHPIIGHKDIPINSKYNGATYADIKIKDDTLRVFNIHLESDKLTTSDKSNLQHIKNTTDANDNAKMVNKKLKEAYYLRENQAEIIGNLVEETKIPVLLCGDTNDVPVSYTYNKLIGSKLTDAFTEKGSGYSCTFKDGYIRFRIDEVMHSGELEATSYEREKVTYSDHYPLIVGLSWTK